MYTKTMGKDEQKIQNERSFEKQDLRNKNVSNVIAHIAII